MKKLLPSFLITLFFFNIVFINLSYADNRSDCEHGFAFDSLSASKDPDSFSLWFYCKRPSGSIYPGSRNEKITHQEYCSLSLQYNKTSGFYYQYFCIDNKPRDKFCDSYKNSNLYWTFSGVQNPTSINDTTQFCLPLSQDKGCIATLTPGANVTSYSPVGESFDFSGKFTISDSVCSLSDNTDSPIINDKPSIDEYTYTITTLTVTGDLDNNITSTATYTGTNSDGSTWSITIQNQDGTHRITDAIRQFDQNNTDRLADLNNTIRNLASSQSRDDRNNTANIVGAINQSASDIVNETRNQGQATVDAIKDLKPLLTVEGDPNSVDDKLDDGEFSDHLNSSTSDAAQSVIGDVFGDVESLGTGEHGNNGSGQVGDGSGHGFWQNLTINPFDIINSGDTSGFGLSRSCPSGTTFAIFNQSISLDHQAFCQGYNKFRPVVWIIAYFVLFLAVIRILS